MYDYSTYSGRIKAHTGQRLKGLEQNRERVSLLFYNAPPLRFEVSGDCCSSSWIEHLEQPPDLDGAIFLGVEDSEAVPWDDHECKECRHEERWDRDHDCDACGHDSLSVYNTRFLTDRGAIVVEYRNDSNGYYGGRLGLVEEDDEDED